MASQSSGVSSDELTRQAESKIAASKTPKQTLQATIEAVESHMRVLKLERDPEQKRKLDAACKKYLKQAENLKATKSAQSKPSIVSSDTKVSQKPWKHIARRVLTTREKIILLEGSKLNGFTFPPWTGPPEKEEFQSSDGQERFVDPIPLNLSPLQQKHFAGWKRASESSSHMVAMAGQGSDLAVAAGDRRKADLVQDITSDCSVVASLCAGSARAERGHPKLLSCIMFPYDHESNKPVFSPNGKYVLRLHFNGCDRKVIIDDFLPTSSTSRMLHVVDRISPERPWPALIEKAYLKARGGYDFPGSNSGTDIAILFGWIPEQIFLHDDELVPEAIWKRISTAFVQHGDVLVTVGTGKLTKREEKELGLAREHDYAVLDMREVDGIREMLIKNPWSDGTVWKGKSRSSVNLTSELQSQSPPSSHLAGATIPGTFWMDFDNVFQHFENLYLNWNPGLFTHREDIHFTWDIATSSDNSGCFISNPQFSISAASGGSVWLLLNKHFQNGDYSSADTPGFVSLYLFVAGGKQVFLSDGALKRGPFVDSPNTLLKTELTPRQFYTVVVASQLIPVGKRNFTLTAFSRSEIDLREAHAKYISTASRTAAWTRNTAGGNSDLKTYTTNPQFCIALKSSASIALLLEILDPSADSPAVHMKVFFASLACRISRIRTRDILGSSGDYRRQSAVLETHLDAGYHTIVCSTFEANQYAKFKLSVFSDVSGVHLTALPAEDAGRLSVRSGIATLTTGSDSLRAPVNLTRTTKAKFIARHVHRQVIGTQAAYKSSSSSPLKLSLEQGRGSYKLVVASSQEEDSQEIACSDNPRIEDLVIKPDLTTAEKGGLWLVLRRINGSSVTSQLDDYVEVEALCEEHIKFGAWSVDTE